MLLGQDGSVWMTGDNKFGQHGDGAADVKNSFVQVISTGIKAIAAGYKYSIVLKQDGSVWATGMNNFGQLGFGTTRSSTRFESVISGGVQAVAAGDWHSMI